MERAALVDEGVGGRWEARAHRIRSATSFRSSRAGRHPLEGVPRDVRDRVGEEGVATLAVDAPAGITVLPVRWRTEGGRVHAALPEEVLGLAGGGPSLCAALAVDHASAWRARAMVGCMIRGEARVHVVDRLRSGRESAGHLVERCFVGRAGAALITLHPSRVVWWRGWTTGTVVA
jgi:hypothetical protein